MARATRTSRTSRSAGISGAIAKRANESSKALGGKVSYYWATLAVFVGWQTGEMRVSVDDEIREREDDRRDGRNGRYLGGGMMMCPEAEPDDGLFDVLLIGDVTKRDLPFVLPKTYRGKHLPHPRLELLRGRVVTSTADEPLPIELDGEQPGTTPARFEVVPRALRLRVPAGLSRRACAQPGAGAAALGLLQRRELLLELRDPRLERVDPAHLLGEVVDPVAEVVDRRDRPLTPRELGEPLERLLARIGEAVTKSFSPIFASAAAFFLLCSRSCVSHTTRAAVLHLRPLQQAVLDHSRPSAATTAASVSPADASTFSSARSSSAVGPRLTIANARASSGRPATGQTSSDEPTTSMSPPPRASSVAAPSHPPAAARRRA